MFSLHSSLCLLLAAILSSIYASQTSLYSNKARLAEALTLVTTLKTEIATEYFQTGHWPKQQILLSEAHSVVQSASFDGNGTINVYFNDDLQQLSNRILSFRAAEIPSQEFSNMLWLCGFATPPASFKSNAKNLTNVDPILLPISCRPTVLQSGLTSHS
jgi:hypothetical protein